MPTAAAGRAAAPQADLFSRSLAESDPELFGCVQRELGRQQDEIELIASENIVSRAVLEARAACSPTNMPRAIPASATTAAASTSTRPRRWPSSAPRSCSAATSPTCSRTRAAQANQAVFMALMQPGDTFMGLNLAAGGHLTHGSPVNCRASGSRSCPTPCAARTTASTWTRSRRSRASTSRR